MIYTVTLNPAVDRELTVPDFAFDTVLRATAWQVDYGGKGFNVSRMLRSLGTPSVALAFTGGRSGELLGDGLAALGIETAFIWVEGETRTNVSIVNEKHDHYIKVNEPGPAIGAEAQAAAGESARAGPARLLVGAGGQLPPGVPAGYYAQIAAAVHEGGGQVVLDSSGEALKEGLRRPPRWSSPTTTSCSSLRGCRWAVRRIVAAARRCARLARPASSSRWVNRRAGGGRQRRGWSPRRASPSRTPLAPGIAWSPGWSGRWPAAIPWPRRCAGAWPARGSRCQPGHRVGERAAVERLYAQTSVEQLAETMA